MNEHNGRNGPDVMSVAGSVVMGSELHLTAIVLRAAGRTLIH